MVRLLGVQIPSRRPCRVGSVCAPSRTCLPRFRSPRTETAVAVAAAPAIETRPSFGTIARGAREVQQQFYTCGVMAHTSQECRCLSSQRRWFVSDAFISSCADGSLFLAAVPVARHVLSSWGVLLAVGHEGFVCVSSLREQKPAHVSFQSLYVRSSTCDLRPNIHTHGIRLSGQWIAI